VATYDLVLKGSTVIDGLRTPRFKGDVAIKDGKIAWIGSVDTSEGVVVDASGKVVAPGVIDLHMHYDRQVVWDLPQERAYDFPAGEWRPIQKATGYERIIVNGATTFIDGECTDATPGKLLRHGTV
jgi:N-acyl-D-aspartate/D-glutamate deacylase